MSGLGASWGRLGPLGAYLGPIEPSWGLLEPFPSPDGAFLGRPGARLPAILERIGPSWGHVGTS